MAQKMKSFGGLRLRHLVAVAHNAVVQNRTMSIVGCVLFANKRYLCKVMLCLAVAEADAAQ